MCFSMHAIVTCAMSHCSGSGYGTGKSGTWEMRKKKKSLARACLSHASPACPLPVIRHTNVVIANIALVEISARLRLAF